MSLESLERKTITMLLHRFTILRAIPIDEENRSSIYTRSQSIKSNMCVCVRLNFLKRKADCMKQIM